MAKNNRRGRGDLIEMLRVALAEDLGEAEANAIEANALAENATRNIAELERIVAEQEIIAAEDTFMVELAEDITRAEDITNTDAHLRSPTEQVQYSISVHIVPNESGNGGILMVPGGENISILAIYPTSICSICLANPPNALIVIDQISCGHMACSSCIGQIMENYNPVCPNCRASFNSMALLTSAGTIEVQRLAGRVQRSYGRSVGRSEDYDQPAMQPVRQPVMQPVRQPAIQPIRQPVRQPVSRSARQFTRSTSVIPANLINYYNATEVNTEESTRLVSNETNALIVHNSTISIGSIVIATASAASDASAVSGASAANGASAAISAPSVLVLVFDISSSMRGPRLSDTQEGFIKLLKNAKGTNEIVCLMSFASEVYYECGAGRVTEENYQDYVNAINRLYASGGTHLSTACNSIRPILEDITVQLAYSGHHFTVGDLKVTVVFATDGEPSSRFVPDVDCIRRIGANKIVLFTVGDDCNATPFYNTLIAALGEDSIVYEPCSTSAEILRMADSVIPFTGCMYTSIQIDITNATFAISGTNSITYQNVENGSILTDPFECANISNMTCVITVIIAATGKVVEIPTQSIGPNAALENEGIRKIITSRFLAAGTLEDYDALTTMLDSAGCIYPADPELREGIATRRANLVAQQLGVARIVTTEQRNADLGARIYSSSGRVSSRSASAEISNLVRQASAPNTNQDGINDHTPTLDRLDESDEFASADVDADVDEFASADVDADVDEFASADVDADADEFASADVGADV